MENSFAPDFEKYIIFHRGIEQVYVDEDYHFHARYQDGTDIDMGDLLKGHADDIQERLAAFEQTLDQKNLELDQAITNAGNITDLAGNLSNAVTTATNAAANAQENANNISSSLGNIGGISSNGEGGYYVDFVGQGYRTAALTDEAILDAIESVIGIDRNSSGNLIINYQNKDISDALTVIANEAIKEVSGISQDAEKGTLSVDPQAIRIADTDINALFSYLGG